MYRPTKRLRTLAGVAGVVAAAALVLTGCGGTNSAAPATTHEEKDWDALVAAAKDEGTVNVYSSGLEADNAKLAEAFEKEYGIKAVFTKMATSDLAQRVEAEVKSGNVQVDVVHMTDAPGLASLGAQNAFAPVWGKDLDAANPKATTDGLWTYIKTSSEVILYRNDLQDPPKSWEDLTDPRFKGKIATYNAENSATISLVYARMLEKYGDDFLTRYAANEPKLYDSGPAALPLLQTGEVSIIAFTVSYTAEQAVADGLDATVLYPDYSPTFSTASAVLAKASHPNAAMLFHNFVLTQEAQEILNGKNHGTSPLLELSDDIELPGGGTDVWNTSDIDGDLASIQDLLNKWGAMKG